MADTKSITLKLMVDKTSNRLLFAESGSDFVDVLLSFLTLPIGRIVRLLKKQSSMGCMDKLYESVERLGDDFLIDSACRTMLLSPMNSSTTERKSLKVNIDDTGDFSFYTCNIYNCSRFVRLLSPYANSKCMCGRNMVKYLDLLPSTAQEVFVKGKPYVIYDDLVITAFEDTIPLLDKLAISDWSNLQERIVKIGHQEVLYLLKRSLISSTPLTDVLLQTKSLTKPLELSPSITHHNASFRVHERAVNINLKLVLSKSNKVLYAEANQDFVDILFSFLTFPVGSFLRHLGCQSSIICLDNLHESANNLRLVGSLLKKTEALLNPMLSTTIRSPENQSISIIPTEGYLKYFRSPTHLDCDHISSRKSTFCVKDQTSMDIALDVQWWYPNMVPLGSGRGYCKPFLYMVTDELAVTPLSIAGVVSLCKGSEGLLEETEISIGEREIQALLLSSLTSKTTALTDALFPVILKRGS